MIIYVELVFIDNLVIDFLMLKTTFCLSKKAFKTKRLILSGFVGGLFALLYPFMTLSGILLPIIKVLTGLVILLIANDFSCFKQFYYHALIFFFLTFLMGGAIYFLASLFNITEMTKYTSIFIVIPFYVVINSLARIINVIYKRKNIVCSLYKTTIEFDGLIISETGFLDTGNGVFFNNCPVVFMDKNCIKNKGFLIKLMKDAKKITVNTVNGQKIKYCLKAKIMLENDRSKKEIYVCFTKINDLSGYKIILHPDVMGVENVKNLETENKTAS